MVASSREQFTYVLSDLATLALTCWYSANLSHYRNTREILTLVIVWVVENLLGSSLTRTRRPHFHHSFLLNDTVSREFRDD